MHDAIDSKQTSSKHCPFVSIVMPIRNEEAYLDNCIESLLLQDYPKERMEWFFVDGCSSDSTADILEKYAREYPDLIKVKLNPKLTAPCAMNVGIESAQGEYIIRLDAHAEYASDYISQCVSCLINTGADNVGGVLKTVGRGFVGGAIAKVLSSRFGVGNSEFRTNGQDGYVDTVPFGAFKRDVFEKWGGFDERLTRNQDNEMNYRIRRNGGKIYLSNSIKSIYYCRNTISGIAKMAMQNGLWNVITMKLCPNSMGVRHFVPLVFFLSIPTLLLLGIINPAAWWVLSIEMGLYLILDCCYSIRASSSAREALLLCLLFPVFHISYGAGSFVGVIKTILPSS